MKLPESIKMGGHNIEVRKVKTDVTDSTGSYNHWRHIIKINIDDTSEDTQSETLLHELIEAIKGTYNLDIDHKDLTVISETLFAIIRDNDLDFRK